MKECPKVSVIMLAYNISAYIETAIRSVLRQETSYNIQLVIAEDCSSDDTLSICQRYKQLYPNQITLVEHEKNVGLQQNFMDAHAHCQGEYIAICDGDDYWIYKKKLQCMTDFMDSHPEYAICFHRVINYYEEDHSKSLSNSGQKKITPIHDLACSNYITNSSSLFRRTYYLQVPQWFSQITSCDYAMHMLNARFGLIYYFKRPMAVYRKHSDGIWSEVNRQKRFNMGITVREYLIDYFREQDAKVYELLRDTHTRFSLNELYHCREAGLTDAAEETERRLLALRPEWDHNEVEKRLRTLPPPKRIIWKCRAFGLLKKARAICSYFIPLPRIR